MQTKRDKNNVRELCFIALMTVFICICSWITIPFVVPFTLQTLGVFFALLMLGGWKGTVAIVLYLLIGAIGVPVFSGFRGGIGHLLGPTGGYLVGFLLAGVVFALLEGIAKKKKVLKIMVLGICLSACYIVGTVWFVIVMNGQGASYSIWNALIICVFPYVVPDIVKIGLALYICRRCRALL